MRADIVTVSADVLGIEPGHPPQSRLSFAAHRWVLIDSGTRRARLPMVIYASTDDCDLNLHVYLDE